MTSANSAALTADTPRLHELWGEILDLSTAQALAQWDQETYMPPHGAQGRASMLATLAGLTHAKLTAPELAEAIDDRAASAEGDDPAEAEVREARRAVEQATKVPEALAREIAEATSLGLGAWQQARAADDFSIFEAPLSRIVDLTCKRADALREGTTLGRYDVLLDEYERGANEADLSLLFADLGASVAPLVAVVADSGVEIDESPATGDFPSDAQLAFGRDVATRMGFAFDAGRIDASAHPFCSGMNPNDVRLTWRWDDGDFRPALFGIMHEAGHGLYEQGLPEEWQRTPIGSAVSLGVHESQSRMWENLVGRSRPFWEWALPQFRKAFPGAPSADLDAIWRSLHVVRPSLIRVEADEVTYNLHIAVRFEVERALIGGAVGVADLPALWNETYESLLGIRPPSDADGVLQDIHWSMGAFGYFPTYTVGNMVSAQLFETAEAQVGPLGEQFAAGDLEPLLGWLRENVHRHGSRYLPGELVERATGSPLRADALVAHLSRTVEDAYGVTA